jgi:hypothetical protein
LDTSLFYTQIKTFSSPVFEVMCLLPIRESLVVVSVICLIVQGPDEGVSCFPVSDDAVAVMQCKRCRFMNYTCRGTCFPHDMTGYFLSYCILIQDKHLCLESGKKYLLFMRWCGRGSYWFSWCRKERPFLPMGYIFLRCNECFLVTQLTEVPRESLCRYSEFLFICAVAAVVVVFRGESRATPIVWGTETQAHESRHACCLMVTFCRFLKIGFGFRSSFVTMSSLIVET